MIRGVIFDMDGLMTDTERLFLELWCQVLGERGLPERRDVVIHCVGLNHRAIEDYVHRELGAEFDYQEMMREVGARVEDYCAVNGVPVKPGLYDLLDELDRQGIPYAVATSSMHAHAAHRLECIGVMHRLQALITGDMVAVGKPDPEIFLKAAEALGLPPEDCLVLEDSPHGILAAHLAGCRPVMIPDLQQPDLETRSLLSGIACRLDQVIPLLREWNR